MFKVPIIDTTLYEGNKKILKYKYSNRMTFAFISKTIQLDN